MRGPRICSTIASTLAATPLSPPVAADQSTRQTSPRATGKRPTAKLQATSRTRPAVAASSQSAKRSRARITASSRRGLRLEAREDATRARRCVARQGGDVGGEALRAQQAEQRAHRGRVEVGGAAGEVILLAADGHEAEPV